MSHQIVITATYAQDADAVFAEAIQFDEMRAAMAGLAVYDGLDTGAVITQGQTYVVDVIFLKLFKNNGHTMFAETVDINKRLVQSREYNPPVTRWDHTLTVDPTPLGCLWTDRVVIDAGWQTGFMSRMALFMYTRRHKHRGALTIIRDRTVLPE